MPMESVIVIVIVVVPVAVIVAVVVEVPMRWTIESWWRTVEWGHSEERRPAGFVTVGVAGEAARELWVPWTETRWSMIVVPLLVAERCRRWQIFIGKGSLVDYNASVVEQLIGLDFDFLVFIQRARLFRNDFWNGNLIDLLKKISATLIYNFIELFNNICMLTDLHFRLSRIYLNWEGVLYRLLDVLLRLTLNFRFDLPLVFLL